MEKRRSIKISEKQLCALWQGCAGVEFTADTGQPVRVLYPGRPSYDSGPDFHGAVIDVEGKILRGDVEVHLIVSDWYGHHHHRDRSYAGIILHVVWVNILRPTLLPSGRRVPAVALAQAGLQGPFRDENYGTCRQHRCQRRLLRLLETAGKHRFAIKVRRFRRRLSCVGPAQVLFEGMMKALGYSRNVKPFLMLARCMRLSFLEGLGNDIEMKQAWLLGLAGLLPGQRGMGKPQEEQPARLEKLWEETGARAVLSSADWQFSGVRPTNFPVRRLVALSYLLQGYPGGLLEGLMRTLNSELAELRPASLADALSIGATGYWENHLDFGVVTGARQVLLGKAKAAEMVVNVLLPFASAWGDKKTRPKFRRLFRAYPPLHENEVTRHLRRQLGALDLAGVRAIHQQGLIHLFNTFCSYGLCQRCPASRPD